MKEKAIGIKVSWGLDSGIESAFFNRIFRGFSLGFGLRKKRIFDHRLPRHKETHEEAQNF
jgi:hypothetical protein